MNQFRRGARLSVITLGLLLAGCGEGQQSDLASKLKALIGGQGATPAAVTEPDPQQARQNKLNDLLKKAEAGDSEAQFELGNEYRKAYDAGKDTARAVELYSKAAAGGHPGAQAVLGDMYARGEGVQKDIGKAKEFWESSVIKGEALAQFGLGYMYRTGTGVTKDTAKALELLQQSAAQGHPYGQTELGVMYWNGDGVPKDKDKAVQLFIKAAEQGYIFAQNKVAIAYEVGWGVAKNAVKAFEWYQKAAIAGDASSQSALGRMYLSGEGIPKDDMKALEWNLKAAAQGDEEAQFRLGMAYLWGHGVATDNVLAYAWSNLANAKGVDRALNIRIMAENKMTPAEIAEAQRLSSGWKVGMLLARESGSAGGGKQPISPGSLAKKNTGTAFIVNAAGHAITNHHVVGGCVEVRAEGRDGVVKVVTSDVVNDLAQLQIPGAVAAQATITSDPAKLRQGEDIVVFGFPLNAVLSSGGNLTPGVVSALTGLGNNTNQIQITAPIQPGSSGSPVINKKGEVVGVVAMKLSDSKMAKATGQVGQNVNFAVSGQTLKTFLDTHKVEYRSGGMFSFGSKSTADLADEARKWTLVVECWK
jgi:TPR repeat protein